MKKLNETYKNGNFILCEFVLIRLPRRSTAKSDRSMTRINYRG